MYFSKAIPNKTAGYFRLSREDGDKMESDSIRNQKDLVADFISNHPDITLVEEYVDDGYTGTNFERPGFQKLLKDIESKKINCIIVKDLSRLGRNYIEMGRYLEKIFPLKGVRFIAINDHYDSYSENSDADQIVIPFKNLINDAYCRDISTKIRSQLDVKRKKGEFVGSFAAYGYKKDPKDKNHLIIDEEAAEIVRLIFSLRLEGYSAQRIAQKLNKMKVATPFEYKRMQGINFNSGFHTGTNPEWIAVNVIRILKNELYTGVMVQGKIQKINYKVKKYREIDEAEWIRVEGTHEPIISKEVFDIIQEVMKRDTRVAPNQDKVYPLSGYVFCGDCGQTMTLRSVRSHGVLYHYYQCSTYGTGGDCSSHLISEKKLSETILATLKMQIRLLTEAEEMAKLSDAQEKDRPGIKALSTQINTQQGEIIRYQNLLIQLYKDQVDGVIDAEEYKNIDIQFRDKIRSCEEAIKGLEDRMKIVTTKNMAERPWMKLFKKYEDAEQVDRQMIVSLIDNIIVYDKEQIEIQYRFGDEINDFLASYGRSEAMEG